MSTSAYADRIQESVATKGTTAFVTSGAVNPTFQPFSVMTPGLPVDYMRQDGHSNIEIGRCNALSIESGIAVITRDAIYFSTNGNAAVNFPDNSGSISNVITAESLRPDIRTDASEAATPALLYSDLGNTVLIGYAGTTGVDAPAIGLFAGWFCFVFNQTATDFSTGITVGGNVIRAGASARLEWTGSAWISSQFI